MDSRGRESTRIDGSLAATPPVSEWLASYPKLREALQTCMLRFVINLPEETLRDAARLCFELQEAQWFYIDFLYEGAKKELPKLNQVNFCHLMLEFSDVLRELYGSPEDRTQVLQDWRDTLKRVPLKGAVLLNERLDKCIMVQPWKGDKWTFPRGKINEGEAEGDCAVREVWEEVGIDISGKVDTDHFVSADIYGSGCPVKLFLVPHVSEETAMAPNTRKEISKIGWMPVTRLPGWEGGPADEASGPVRFFCVKPFVQAIKKWVLARRSTPSTPAPKRSAASAAPIGSVPICSEAAVPEGPERKSRKNGLESSDCEKALVLDMRAIMTAFDRGWERGKGSNGAATKGSGRQHGH